MLPHIPFDKVISLSNLRNAWVKAKHYAETESVFVDSFAYELFEQHLEANLAALQYELSNASYRPSHLRYLSIPKGNQERKLYFNTPCDAVVVQAVINVIGPHFETLFGQESYGNRLNVGDKESRDPYRRWQDLYASYISAVRGFLDEGPDGWYLITDLENFYPSINLQRLSGLIAAEIHDERVLALLNLFLRLKALGNDEHEESVSGLPAGTLYAHFLANIYLVEFDKLAIQLGQGYARYVDDICLVCKDKDSLDAAERALRSYLEQWGQNFKVAKTERHPVTYWEPLVAHTNKMQYAGQIDIAEPLAVEAGDIAVAAEASNLFRELYLVVEQESDVDRLVQEAGFVISKLRRLGAADLSRTIYTLLDLHPLRPSTLRVAFSCLLEIGLPEPSQAFREYITRGNGRASYQRISLLQILPHYAKRAGDIASLLWEEFCTDPNYLVRAQTFVALGVLASEGSSSLNIEQIGRLRRTESSPFALLRLIGCYSAVVDDAIWLHLASAVSENVPETQAVIAHVASQLLHTKRAEPMILDALLPSLLRATARNTRSYVYLFYTVCRFGSSWMIAAVLDDVRGSTDQAAVGRIFRIIASEVIEQLASDNLLGRLYQFAESINQAGLNTEASLAAEEIMSRTQDPELQGKALVFRDAYRKVAISAGLPAWYTHDPNCLRGLFRSAGGAPDYKCLSYHIDATDLAGTAEFISVTRISENGFSDASEWFEYLRGLDKGGLISLADVGIYDDGGNEYVFCFYRKPAGFQALTTWLTQSNAAGLFSPRVVLELGASLVQAMFSTQHNSFLVASVDPLNVLWNPVGQVMLWNIGASLGISNYQCGTIGCSAPIHRGELGSTGALYNLGLLLLQLLERQCPVILTESVFKREKSPGIAGLERLPHFHYILRRLLQQEPDYRYRDFHWLEHDIAHAVAFVQSMETTQKSEPTNMKAGTDRQILCDFVTFRLSIIARDPDTFGEASIPKADRMLRELSKSLANLPNSMLSAWPVHLRHKRALPALPTRSETKKLSPEGGRLIALAEGWQSVTSCGETEPDLLAPVTKLCLYHALSVEAAACLMTAVALPSDTLAAILDQMRKLLSIIVGEFRGESSIDLTIRSPSSGSEPPLVVPVSMRDLQELQGFIVWLSSTPRMHYNKRPSSLRAMGLFLSLFGFGDDWLRNDRRLVHGQPILQLRQSSRQLLSRWLLLKGPCSTR